MRLIQAPGVQVTENIKNEYADTTDNSIVNTASFMMGFSDKGTDYETKYVNSMDTYKKMFGNPENEAEKYLYNAVYETINRGGNAYVAKLPYDNNSFQKYTYVTYTVLSNLYDLCSSYDVVTNTYGFLKESLFEFLLFPNSTIKYLTQLIDEEELDYILTEDEKYLLVDTDGELKALDYFNDNDINLSIITDLFEFLQDKFNFEFSTRKAIREIFYKDDNNCRNDSIYMLIALNESIDKLKEFDVSEELLNKYREELEKVRSVLTSIGSYQNLIKMFGESKTLKYYQDYVDALIVEVENVTSDVITTKVILQVLYEFQKTEIFHTKYTSIKQIDNSITKYMMISSDAYEDSGMLTIDDLDKFRTGNMRPSENKIQIVDISRGKYKSENNILDKNHPMEYLGILPIITSAPNAMFVQNLISQEDNTFSEYCAVSSIQNIYTKNEFKEGDQVISVQYTIQDMNNDNIQEKGIVGFTNNIGGEENANYQQLTLSKQASKLFPQINTIGGRIDRENLKKIGIVVFEMYVDSSQDYKIAFTPVEAYVGSLKRNDIDQSTNSSIFIDTVVNSNSQRINVFSNVKFSQNANVPLYNTDKTSIFMINNQNATSLGFYSKDTLKKISVNNSVLKAIDRIFDNSRDVNTFEFDILVDAGVSTIAQMISQMYGNNDSGYFETDSNKNYLITLLKQSDIEVWQKVIEKYNDLCKNDRKDCMFIADNLRSLCLNGNQKRVRNTRPQNTFKNTVLNDYKWTTGIVNSSYGAGYCNWFLVQDAYSKDTFWCPPSIKMNGIYIYTDAYSQYWNAPAGMSRGKLPSDVIDVAFTPDETQAGTIYNGGWNYAVSYPLNGIIAEGQKTFQKEKTSLDRVNVRRLMLGLEKRVKYIAKFFKYEQITDYIFTRFKDSITPIFDDAKDKGGISDYYIVCDSRNNNTQTIENHELHCAIAVKPVLALEYILLNFIATSQGADVQETAIKNV